MGQMIQKLFSTTFSKKLLSRIVPKKKLKWPSMLAKRFLFAKKKSKGDTHVEKTSERKSPSAEKTI